MYYLHNYIIGHPILKEEEKNNDTFKTVWTETILSNNGESLLNPVKV